MSGTLDSNISNKNKATFMYDYNIAFTLIKIVLNSNVYKAKLTLIIIIRVVVT